MIKLYVTLMITHKSCLISTEIEGTDSTSVPEAAQIDAQEIQQRIVYSLGYERSRLEIIEIEHAKYFNKEGD